MFTGKQFCVKTPTTAIDETDAQKNVLTLSAGAVINVIDGPKPDNPLMRVVSGRKWLLMMEQDIRNHCEEIIDGNRSQNQML